LLHSSKKNPDVITTHCFLHWEVLVSKTIGEDLKQVLDVAVNMVNFIKQRPLKSRMFAKLCENMQKDHVTLLQHTEVRWLSRGKVLTRVFELREELLLFFKDNNKAGFSDFLEDTKWLLKLAYLADVYQHLNTLNTSMQGPKEIILTSIDKLLAFKNKLQVWKKKNTFKVEILKCFRSYFRFRVRQIIRKSSH
jgi:ribosomal protein L23